MFDFHERIESIISNGKTFTDICARYCVQPLIFNNQQLYYYASVPIADIFQTKRRKRRQVRVTACTVLPKSLKSV